MKTVPHDMFPCRYMKYLYPFECEKKGLSSPGELQAAIDSNRREGRRPSYANSLYRYSPSPSSAPHSLLSSSAIQTTPTSHNGLNTSPSPTLKKKTGRMLCVLLHVWCLINRICHVLYYLLFYAISLEDLCVCVFFYSSLVD